jgi:hypothetical protein
MANFRQSAACGNLAWKLLVFLDFSLPMRGRVNFILFLGDHAVSDTSPLHHRKERM